MVDCTDKDRHLFCFFPSLDKLNLTHAPFCCAALEEAPQAVSQVTRTEDARALLYEETIMGCIQDKESRVFRHVKICALG